MKSYEYRDNLGNPRDYYDIVNDATKFCEEIEILNKELEKVSASHFELFKENKRLNNIIDELEKWLKSEIKRIEDIKNPKHSTTFSPKPYGREREYYEIIINSYKYCLDKLKELEKGDSNE